MTDPWFKKKKIEVAIEALMAVRDEEMLPVVGSFAHRGAIENMIGTLTFYQLAYEPYEP